ncbi:MAG: DUF1206 domain-containing protein [Solirubrobacteraceae bacterium]
MSTAPERSGPLSTSRAAVSQTSGRDGRRGAARAGLVVRGVVYRGRGRSRAQACNRSPGERPRARPAHCRRSATSRLARCCSSRSDRPRRGRDLAADRGPGAVTAWRRPRPSAPRRGPLGSGVGYAALPVAAVKIIAGARASSGSPKHTAAGVLGWRAGPVIVAVAGAVVIGVGAHQAYKGVSRKFEEESRVALMSAATRTRSRHCA